MSPSDSHERRHELMNKNINLVRGDMWGVDEVDCPIPVNTKPYTLNPSCFIISLSACLGQSYNFLTIGSYSAVTCSSWFRV